MVRTSKTELVAVRLPLETVRRARLEAERRQVTFTDILKRAVERHLEEQCDKKS